MDSIMFVVSLIIVYANFFFHIQDYIIDKMFSILWLDICM